MVSVAQSFTVTHSPTQPNAPSQPPTSTTEVDALETQWYYCRPGFIKAQHLTGGKGLYYFMTEKEAVTWALLNHVNLALDDQSGHIGDDLTKYNSDYVEPATDEFFDCSDGEEQDEDEGEEQDEDEGDEDLFDCSGGEGQDEDEGDGDHGRGQGEHYYMHQDS